MCEACLLVYDALITPRIDPKLGMWIVHTTGVTQVGTADLPFDTCYEIPYKKRIIGVYSETYSNINTIFSFAPRPISTKLPNSVTNGKNTTQLNISRITSTK